jgi:hypothetical protein
MSDTTRITNLPPSPAFPPQRSPLGTSATGVSTSSAGTDCFSESKPLSPWSVRSPMDEEIAGWRSKRLVPTLIIVTALEGARHVLPNTSRTALRSLASREAQRQHRDGAPWSVPSQMGSHRFATHAKHLGDLADSEALFPQVTHPLDGAE